MAPEFSWFSGWFPLPYATWTPEMKSLLKLLYTLTFTALPLSAQATQSSSTATAAEPRKVSYCELADDPAAYNHELVQLTAFVTHGFEDFTLTQPNCATPVQHFSIWIEYGGKAESNTVYCCPGEAAAETRSEPLIVEGVQIPLISDMVFQQFTDLLKKESDTTVRVTVVGTFFSGKKQTFGGPAFWGGFGHLGCCSLFVIQRVEWFDPHARSDVDYTSEAGWYEKEGCKLGSLQYLRHISISYSGETTEQAIEEQRLADNGTQVWAFNEPQRVAVESLRPFYKNQIPVLRTVTKTPARQVFRWRNKKKSIVVVVTRPYWLSFYAKSNSVAWVSTTIKESDCN
jgi:hypothetical protein